MVHYRLRQEDGELEFSLGYRVRPFLDKNKIKCMTDVKRTMHARLFWLL